MKVIDSLKGKKYSEIEATVSKISNTGLVEIDFNQKIGKVMNSSTMIDLKVLKISLTDKNGKVIEDDLEYEW